MENTQNLARADRYRVRRIVGSEYDERHRAYFEKLECGHDGRVIGLNPDGATRRRCYLCHR